jgi:serine/threonine-protein kinase
MKPERIDYGALIESLADGVAVDWDAIDAAATTDAERRRFGNLKLVARMAELHRTIAAEESATGPALDDVPEAWGHLRIHERIAGGAFGDVYLARDMKLDREVALKLLRPSTRRPLDRLLDEARTLARVQHRNVVAVYGADVRDGRAGLWMELIAGQTLTSWVRAHGPMGPREAAAVGADLCGALAAVHAAGLVHGDVKAQNVMREDGGRIVLMDFGAGHVQGMGAAAGTPIYLAPEVLQDTAPTPRSDIYSLGVLLFHLLTGAFPNRASDIEGLRAAHAAGSRVFLRDLRPDLPQPMVDAIERALDANPARRFASAGEMERALTNGLGSARQGWSWPWMIAASLAVVVAGLLALTLPRIGGTVARASSVAVLPFSPAADDSRHLVDGLSADLTRELQRFDVQVKRTTPGQVVLPGSDAEQRLGAEALVRGTVTGTTGRQQLHVTVMRAGGAEWWSEDYGVVAEAVPTLARRIAVDLARVLGAKPREGAPAPAHQTNYRAYDAYLRGRALAERRGEGDLQRSLVFFDQAAALDSSYAQPHAGKADSYIALGQPAFGRLSPLETRRLAKESALKALELDPNLVEAHTSLAMSAFVHDWDWAAAEARFRKAIALNPQYALAHHWYSQLLNETGRFEEASAEIKRAQALEPLSLLIHRDFAWQYFHQRRYDEAIAQLQETLTLDPDYHPALTLLARALAAAGRYDEGLAALERARPLIPANVYLSFRGHIEAIAGRTAAAENTLAQLRAVASKQYVSPYYIALINAALGRTDDALSALERSYAEQDTVLVSVYIDPRFDGIRAHPRFQALIARMRFPQPAR